MHVRFTADHDYVPSRNPRVTIAYKAGHQLSVTRECGEAAVKAGKAEKIPTPPRKPAAAAPDA